MKISHFNIAFKQIPFDKKGNNKIVKDYTVQIKNDSDVFVHVEEDYENNHYRTVIDNMDFDNLAKNEFSINKNKKTISNGCMDVWDKKDRGKGLGIILHLNNIMELMENDLDKIELHSIGSAVLFHGKCKFQPELRTREAIEDVLYEISLKDYAKMPVIKDSVTKAVDYLNEIHFTGGLHCLDKENILKVNRLISEYIDSVNSQKLSKEERFEYGFSSGFDMSLSREDIIENREFFNKLFEKYGIDYKIKDSQS